MWNKKAMNGSYVAIGLIIGLIIGIVLMAYLYNNNILSAGFLPI